MKLTVIGAGPGSEELLTLRAREAICRAKTIYSTPRLGAGFAALNPAIEELSLSDMLARLDALWEGEAAVIASGDVGFYSIAATLAKRYPEAEIERVPGLASFQVLAARLGLGYEDMKLYSLHGRGGGAVGPVSYHKRCFFLTGGAVKAHDLLSELCAAGLGGVWAAVGENLSLETERVLTGTAEELSRERFADLAVVCVENPQAADPSRVLLDGDFTRAKVPMTKQEIRDLSLAKLAIRPADVLWDVGSGTGSVSIAMAYRAHEGAVWAIEKNPEALALAGENRARLGAWNLTLRGGKAPEGLRDFPAPDRVFIGGSGGNLEDIFALILEKNPAARVVVNAVTLETVGEAQRCFERFGLDYEAVCVNAAAAERLGRYRLMKAQNPVYIFTGERAHD